MSNLTFRQRPHPLRERMKNRVIARANSVDCFSSCSTFMVMFVLESHHLPLTKETIIPYEVCTGNISCCRYRLWVKIVLAFSAKEFMGQKNSILATIWLTIDPKKYMRFSHHDFMAESLWEAQYCKFSCKVWSRSDDYEICRD